MPLAGTGITGSRSCFARRGGSSILSEPNGSGLQKDPQPRPPLAGRWVVFSETTGVHPHHFWSCDFVIDQTTVGQLLKLLVVMDEYNRECLAIDVQRLLTSQIVQEDLGTVSLQHGCPAYIWSNNGPAFEA